MKRLGSPSYLTLARVYVVAALVFSGIFSPLPYALVPWAMLLLFLYLGFHRGRVQFGVSLYLFLAFSLPLLFQSIAGDWLSPLFGLPVIVLLDHSLSSD